MNSALQHNKMKMPNGLDVIVIHKPGYNQMSAVLTCDFGSCHRKMIDSTGEQYTFPLGTAHFIEHQLFVQDDGTDVSEVFSSLGARVNAFTTSYQTGYCVTTATCLEESLALLIGFVCAPCFTEDSVIGERDIIAQEWKLYADDPFSSGYQQLMKKLYPDHAIGEDIVGTLDTIRDMTASVLKEAYRQFYVPARMNLVVVGPLLEEEVVAIVQQQTGEFYDSPSVSRTGSEPLFPSEQEVSYQYSEVSQSILMVGARFESALGKQKTVFKIKWCLELLCELLFGTMSKFYEQFEMIGWIDTTFHHTVQLEREIHCIVFEGMTNYPAEVRQAIEHYVTNWQNAPDLTQEQFEQAIKGKIGDIIREWNDSEALANSVAQEGEHYLESLSFLQQLTMEDILHYGQQYWQQAMFSGVIIS